MFNSKKRWLLALFFFLIAAFVAPAGEGKLPDPDKTGGPPIFKVFDDRASGNPGEFSGPVQDKELATILWTATGQNRNAGGWTVPMAMGAEPYCKIYVAGAEGVFLYDWRDHALEKISQRDARDVIGMQDFVKDAYYSLVVVADSNKLREFRNSERENEYALMATGAIAQHVYLAAQALDVKTRMICSIKKRDIAKRFSLSANDRPLCLMLLGRPK